jgi:hypothetical protein
MNPANLKIMVYEMIALDREITEKDAQLKQMKAELIEEAREQIKTAKETEGGGKSVTFEGLNGCIARVTFPADKLKDKIDGEAKGFPKIKESAGRFFARLFLPAVVFKPIDYFREEAVQMLGNVKAKKLIKLCTSKSSTTVSFETKESAS